MGSVMILRITVDVGMAVKLLTIGQWNFFLPETKAHSKSGEVENSQLRSGCVYQHCSGLIEGGMALQI